MDTLNQSVPQSGAQQAARPTPAAPAPAPRPLQAKSNPTNVVGTIKDQLVSTLGILGQDTEALQPQIDQFMASIAPAITQAVSDGDLTTLRYVKDQVAAHLGRVSLGYLAREQQVVQATVMTALSMVIKAGLAAV